MTTATATAARYLGRCTRGHAFRLDLEHASEINNPANRYCDCGAARVKVNRVVGRYTEKTCGARCTSAISGACDCSCGGENHGSDHH